MSQACECVVLGLSGMTRPERGVDLRLKVS